MNIPVYNNHNDINKKHVYSEFYDKYGCMILKNVFEEKTMDKYNSWCENWMEEAMKDKNCRHPKQENKILINNVIGRMSKDNPELLTQLIGNEILNTYVDSLLGLGKIGACTTHWLEPGGKRQKSHVDYPLHVGSGKFWENDPSKVEKIITKHQLEQIMPYFSVQVLIASDKMDVTNGSTEMIPGSHLWSGIDVDIHKPEIYESLEDKFINASLEKGDVLIFCRRLCHRGGENISSKRRNSLIIQYVWSWGVGQEIMEKGVFQKLQSTYQYGYLSEEHQQLLKLRLEFPYPRDVSEST